ncbi:MAG: hypothetical protein ABSG30_00260 [Steroidobacteraceae bacterium]|jgi:hypothetical protein
MSRTGISHLAILVTALSAAAPWSARADAPPVACKFLTIDQVSAALGTPVTAGGKISTVDHVGATVSSCMWMAGRTTVVLSVDERGTADAAMTAYRTQLADSQSKSKDTMGARDEQKTTPESGIGEGAYAEDRSDGSSLGMTAVHGTRVFTLGALGAGSLPHEGLRNLMQTAVSH